MPEDVFVDLQYQGIELGSRLCMQEFTESVAYLQCPQPMPVGSAMVIRAGEALEIPVQVQQVQEQIAGSERPPGMFVTASALEGAARDWWSSHASSAAAANPAATELVDAADTEEMPAMSEEDAASVEQTEVSAAAPHEEAAAEAKPEAETAEKTELKAKAEESASAEKKPKKKRRRRKKK